MNMNIKQLLLLCTIPLFFVGCGSSPLLSNNLLNVKVIAGQTSTPLSIHFYTLKSDNVFKKLDYFELVDSKHINWHGELLSHAKTLLLPGHREIFQVPVSADMQYYALVIGFKDVKDNDNWRYIQQVSSSGGNVALKLSQERDGYTSRKVESVSADEDMSNTNTSSSHINKIGTKVEDMGNKMLDRSVNHVYGRVFN